MCLLHMLHYSFPKHVANIPCGPISSARFRFDFGDDVPVYSKSNYWGFQTKIPKSEIPQVTRVIGILDGGRLQYETLGGELGALNRGNFAPTEDLNSQCNDCLLHQLILIIDHLSCEDKYPTCTRSFSGWTHLDLPRQESPSTWQ